MTQEQSNNGLPPKARRATAGLPKGWVWTTIKDVCDELIGGGTPSRQVPEYFGGNIVWLTPTEIAKHNILTIYDSREKLSELGLTESSARLIPTGAVLLTSRASIGFVAIVGCQLSTNQGFASFVCTNALMNLYLAHWLKHQKQKLEREATGTTFKEISKAKLRGFDFPLPPLPEQHRIVAKIEELFTKLDAGVKALNEIKVQLKRYRQSVLKSAFEGKLTAEWRNAHKGELGSASILLEQIKEERKKKLGNRYKEFPPIDTSELPELPEGWVWANLEELAANEPNSITDGPFGSNLKTSHYTTHGPRVIRLQNIADGEFIDEYAHISPNHFNSLKKHQIFAGDIVIASLGSEPPRSCIIPESVGVAIVKADCIRFNTHPLMKNRWINFALNSDPTRKWGAKVVHGVGRPRLGLGKIRMIPIPVPSATEQNQIVSEIERCFSVADAIEKTVEQSLAQSERLRQSILKRAFEGKLVPQDPTDPPASELLEQIKRDRREQERTVRGKLLRKNAPALKGNR
ncbi:MAG: restriction endonuclease subunit S [Ignavibacteria bacterium]|nr:restriction endonuclease subunit S [Ignavibacteria bacterium]MBI3765934.1 restriction endonuclease subunit S [Ignavibacteriales bacterium]